MNKTEFAVIQRAAAILDKEEIHTRQNRLRFSRKAHRKYRNEVAQADESLSSLVHTIEENVDLISPFWNSELEGHISQGEYPKEIVYNYYIGRGKKGTVDLNISDSSADPEGSPVYEGYDFRREAEEDLQTMQNMGYKFFKPVKL